MTPLKPYSGLALWAKTMAPAPRRRETAGASSTAGVLSLSLLPSILCQPAVRTNSLIETGAPSSGDSALPARHRDSDPRAASRDASPSIRVRLIQPWIDCLGALEHRRHRLDRRGLAGSVEGTELRRGGLSEVGPGHGVCLSRGVDNLSPSHAQPGQPMWRFEARSAGRLQHARAARSIQDREPLQSVVGLAKSRRRRATVVVLRARQIAGDPGAVFVEAAKPKVGLGQTGLGRRLVAVRRLGLSAGGGRRFAKEVGESELRRCLPSRGRPPIPLRRGGEIDPGAKSTSVADAQIVFCVCAALIGRSGQQLDGLSRVKGLRFAP